MQTLEFEGRQYKLTRLPSESFQAADKRFRDWMKSLDPYTKSKRIKASRERGEAYLKRNNLI